MWRYRLVILTAVLVSGVLGYVLSSLQPASYEATSTMVLRDPSDSRLISDGAFYGDPDRYVAQQADLVAARPVLRRVAERVPGQTVESLEENVTVEPDVSSSQISVTAMARTGQAAADIANAVTQAYVDVSLEQRLEDVEAGNSVLQEQIAEMRATVQELNNRLRRNPDDAVAADRLRTIETELLVIESRTSELAADAAVFGSGVRLREEAQVPESPASPQPLRDALLLMVLALAVSWAVAYWRAGSHRRVEARTDPGSVLNVPLLGEIPRFKGVGSGPTGVLPGTEASEAYEFVLSSIEFSLADLGATSVLITSAAPGDGKTSTALHLAVASAREAHDVILVDTDVRAHGLTSLLRAQEHDGLVELAKGEVELKDCIRRYRLSDNAHLSVVPAGTAPDESTGIMRAPEFKNALQQIKDWAELTILDSPPLLAIADATVLATQVDAIVLVVDSQTEMEQLLKVQERLAFVPTPLIGYVYNRASIDRATAYGYTYGSQNGGDGRGRFSPLRLFATPPADDVSGGSNGHSASTHSR